MNDKIIEENILINHLHKAITIITPLLLFGLLAYLMFTAFGRDFYAGIRSVCGFLLPLIAITFIFAFQRELLNEITKIPTLNSFMYSFVFTFIVMIFFTKFTSIKSIPIAEVVLSLNLFLLLFTYINVQENRILSFFYGAITGLLLFVIIFGLKLPK